MPSLSVRALAELMALPGYEQYRVLYDQKYPKRQPGVFRAPYYSPALRGIRAFYASGNSLTEIEAVRLGLGSVGNAVRRGHNERVLASFVDSPQSARNLSPLRNPRLSTSVGDTDVRVNFDLVASDGSVTRRMFYNMRAVPLEENLARTTIEVAHWLLGSCGIRAGIDQLEYVDLANDGMAHVCKKGRASTVKRAEQTLKVVEALWPTI